MKLFKGGLQAMENTLRPAAIFSDNMVLQRNKSILVWGQGRNERPVTVTLLENGSVIAQGMTKVHQGRWKVEISRLEAGGPYKMTVSDGEETLTFQNVMIGEVWLAGGQSNMEWELQKSANGEEVVASANNKFIRFYQVPRLSYKDDTYEKEESKSCWQECTPQTCGTWSAVGYFYAKRLYEALGITLGIIGCNWGGTSASAWMSREMLLNDNDTRTYVDEYEKATEGRSFEQYCEELKEYNEWYAKWQKRVDQLYKENPDILWSKVQEIAGPCRWPEPLGPKSPFRPSGLYETMLKRVIPYSLRGFIYYQGESDDHKPTLYAKLLTKLIEEWRGEWADDRLPFLFVQLTMYRAREDEDKKHWAVLREQQMKVHQTIKNTGIAVIPDCGQFDNIHPLDKETVGNRLALQALYHVYDRKVAAYGPIYRDRILHDGYIELLFDYVENSLVTQGDTLEGFEIAGEDMNFIPATAIIQGERILVAAEGIQKSSYARYAWTNFGPVTVFNGVGLPLAPFRTI